MKSAKVTGCRITQVSPTHKKKEAKKLTPRELPKLGPVANLQGAARLNENITFMNSCSLSPDSPVVKLKLSTVGDTASVATAKVEVVPELCFAFELQGNESITGGRRQ